jgi:hypothetical protein
VFVALLSGAALGADAGDLGSPPSGEVPILFNDHTVYAKPDVLKQARVLAALVRDGAIYVPLRSMFEQMGATVSASADGKTVTADKPGASVSVTLGKAEVVINGESRPLDVPPMLYHGVVLVPVRVLSEALGAYVQWVPDRRVVVVRYIAPPAPAPPAPVPTAPPTLAPTAPPTLAPAAPPALAPPVPVPTPTAPPAEHSYTGFVEGAYSEPINANEFVADGYCASYLLDAAYAPQDSALAVKVDFRHDEYVTSSNAVDSLGNHYTQFATIDGGTAFTPVFMARQDSIDARLEFRVASPRIYVGVGYLHTTTSYGYPSLDGIGAGIEKLPDLRPGIGFYGSAFYYPNAAGNYTIANPASANNGATYRQEYRIVKYDIGASLVLAHSPVYVHGGYSGDRYMVRQNAPIGQIHAGPYIGLGVKI